MASVDAFELIKRLSQVPLEPLVQALRNVHEQRAGPGMDIRNLLDAAGQVPPSPAAGEAATPKPSAYEAARRHFVQHAEKLREQAILAERLLDGLTRDGERATVVALQHEVHVACLPGERSATTFALVNRLQRTVDVHFRPGRVHELPPGQNGVVELSFVPQEPRLAPGETVDVQLLLDVRDNDILPGALNLGVDVLGDDQLLSKLWVRIELRA
jgi:hypothetical protein